METRPTLIITRTVLFVVHQKQFHLAFELIPSSANMHPSLIRTTRELWKPLEPHMLLPKPPIYRLRCSVRTNQMQQRGSRRYLPVSPPFTPASHILMQTSYADLNQLGVSLCASVGGIDAILSEEDKLFSTASLEISATPTYPPDVTGIDQASTILATATPAPNLGNPAGGTDPGIFPPCTVRLVSPSASVFMLRSLSLTWEQ